MSTGSELSEIVAREVPHVRDFATLTELCDGAWPGDVLQALRTLEGNAATALRDGISRPAGRVRSDRRLPLAHPLDADWRFTRATAEHILDTLLAASPADGDILLIAMPTVALAAYDRGLIHRIVVASRYGDPIDTALRVVLTECRFIGLRDLPHGGFPTVALDPPWYDDVALPLVDIAVHSVACDGHVFLCTPDRLTLPSSARRLSALIAVPDAFGFISVAPIGQVRYATPFFELRCLASMGIANVSPRWRTGRLYACRPGSWARARPRPTAGVGRDWREVRHGPIRIWVRRPPTGEGAAAIAVASSISRTDRTRDVAALWTSGNTFAAHVGTIEPSAFRMEIGDPAWPAWRSRVDEALAEEFTALGRMVDFD
ncbi:hypothetical protein MKK68_09980 [Methylobacterium sp. E-016]|uniref:hypothetical protein n=1 Tax=Methylobacterium sp. E-016 TaxID=2836556 RepID=UPI001FBB7186|nr:hypothetical protein [Methylobacterium sp. E-016]MCJ2075982.1 hypothetical protein [Methylobacterium sp. E-016]